MQLFDIPKTTKPRRVLMGLTDAGADGYSQWKCPNCSGELEVWFTNHDWPASYREPCPICGPTWGKREGSRRVITNEPSKPEPWPDELCAALSAT